GRVLVDGKGVGDIGSVVLRDRQLLAESGLVAVSLVIDRAGRVVSGPEIASRGFVYMQESQPLIDEIKQAVMDAVTGRSPATPFDPAQAPGEQQGPVGPVGIWLGWAFFHALGYAGFLFPLLLAVVALSAFVRPLVVTRGWPPFAGVGIIVLSATGLLAETSVLLATPTDHAGAGGLVGWAVVGGLRTSLGDVGAWLVLIAGVPIGVLFITQVSYGAISRMVNTRLKRWRKAKPGRTSRATATLAEPF